MPGEQFNVDLITPNTEASNEAIEAYVELSNIAYNDDTKEMDERGIYPEDIKDDYIKQEYYSYNLNQLEGKMKGLSEEDTFAVQLVFGYTPDQFEAEIGQLTFEAYKQDNPDATLEDYNAEIKHYRDAYEHGKNIIVSYMPKPTHKDLLDFANTYHPKNNPKAEWFKRLSFVEMLLGREGYTLSELTTDDVEIT